MHLAPDAMNNDAALAITIRSVAAAFPARRAAILAAPPQLPVDAA